MKIYETAVRQKLRFNYKGVLAVEDLWDLNVMELDEVYKELNSKKKQISEDSLLETKNVADVILETKIKIVKHVVKTKQLETETRKLAAERREKKQKIMAIISRKQDSELEDKSAEELHQMLESL